MVVLAHGMLTVTMSAALLGMALALVVVPDGPRRRPGGFMPRALLAAAVGAVTFQVLHFLEHVLQAGYWVLHPTAAPWLTPWAAAGRDVLAATVDGQAGSGNELLHLLGNAIFLGGLMAGLAFARVCGPEHAPTRWLQAAIVVQAVHFAEHIALTATWFARGEARGLSTLLWVLDAGTVAASTTRVWFHFGINLVATVLALVALKEIHAAVDHWRAAPPHAWQPYGIADRAADGEMTAAGRPGP